ncbi:MAG: cytochrome c peroxidase [Acidobacteriota bacterium]
MKKILILAVVLAAIVLAFPLSNMMRSKAVDPALSAMITDPGLQELLPVLQQKCFDCHSENASLPFYGSFPVAKGVIENDRQRALNYFNMTKEILSGNPVSEDALACLQKEIEEGSMPPSIYRLLHWNAGVTEAEAADIMNWIRAARAMANSSDNADDPIYSEPLLPLVPVKGLDPDKVALGEKLFHDTRLSGDNTVSCASCHDLSKGGTDQAPVSTGIRGQQGPINSPTVFNAVYGLAQFWDGRARDLQEQAAGPVTNPLEMGSNWDEVLGKLQDDKEYVAAFQALYPEGMTRDSITDAIAQFEKSLVTTNSRFDRFLRGEADAMTAEEKDGYKLFKTYGCYTCHVGQAMGGQSFEKMGRLRDYFGDRGNITGADEGRYNVTREDPDRHVFKVPSLRNIELTFPYFHDASAKDLNQAVTIMAKYQVDREITEEEARLMARFLTALTGEYEGQPLK